METTKPRTVSSIGMFDMLKGAGMLAIVLGHTGELYPLQLEGGLSLTAFVGFIYRETLMAAFFIASGYGFRKRSISKCIHQQLKSLLKPFCYTACFTTVLHFIIHYKTFHYLPGSLTESIKVAGGFLLGLPHTATYFGQEFFSCGPMWYLLALLMGWILLDVILNIFPERYIPWAVGGAALLGWGASLVWELPFCLIQGAVITPYLYLGYLAKRQHWLDQPLSRRMTCILWAALLLIPAATLATGRTDCVSMAEWTMGPVSILLDGLVGLLFGFGFGSSILYCGIGLVVFMLLTAYDTQKLQQMYSYYAADAEMAEKASIYGALTLYLDFINIFLYVVRLLGNNRRRN